MTPFAAPLDDILFSPRHVAQADDSVGFDAELAGDLFGHFAAFAERVIAPLNASGDADGARLEHGPVRLPTGFPAAFAELASGGWCRARCCRPRA